MYRWLQVANLFMSFKMQKNKIVKQRIIYSQNDISAKVHRLRLSTAVIGGCAHRQEVANGGTLKTNGWLSITAQEVYIKTKYLKNEMLRQIKLNIFRIWSSLVNLKIIIWYLHVDYVILYYAKHEFPNSIISEDVFIIFIIALRKIIFQSRNHDPCLKINWMVSINNSTVYFQGITTGTKF